MLPLAVTSETTMFSLPCEYITSPSKGLYLFTVKAQPCTYCVMWGVELHSFFQHVKYDLIAFHKLVYSHFLPASQMYSGFFYRLTNAVSPALLPHSYKPFVAHSLPVFSSFFPLHVVSKEKFILSNIHSQWNAGISPLSCIYHSFCII